MEEGACACSQEELYFCSQMNVRIAVCTLLDRRVYWPQVHTNLDNPDYSGT